MRGPRTISLRAAVSTCVSDEIELNTHKKYSTNIHILFVFVTEICICASLFVYFEQFQFPVHDLQV